MDGALLMMRQGDRSGLMKYVGEEIQIKKDQEFCFNVIQWVILNLADHKIE